MVRAEDDARPRSRPDLARASRHPSRATTVRGIGRVGSLEGARSLAPTGCVGAGGSSLSRTDGVWGGWRPRAVESALFRGRRFLASNRPRQRRPIRYGDGGHCLPRAGVGEGDRRGAKGSVCMRVGFRGGGGGAGDVRVVGSVRGWVVVRVRVVALLAGDLPILLAIAPQYTPEQFA